MHKSDFMTFGEQRIDSDDIQKQMQNMTPAMQTRATSSVRSAGYTAHREGSMCFEASAEEISAKWPSDQGAEDDSDITVAKALVLGGSGAGEHLKTCFHREITAYKCTSDSTLS